MKLKLILLLLLILGCEPSIKSGRVVDKIYKAAYSETVPVHVSDIEIGDVKMPIYANRTYYYPEKFHVVIENENKDGKLVRRTVEVSKVMYEQYQLKDWAEFPE